MKNSLSRSNIPAKNLLRVIHRIVEPDCHDLLLVQRKLPALVQHRGNLLKRVVVALRFLVAAREIQQQRGRHGLKVNPQPSRNRYGSRAAFCARCAPMHVLLSRLRITSLTEAVSYLLLMAIAMPLKYLAGMPLAVKVMGMIHGVLFLILLWLLVRSHFETKWPKSRLWLLAFASLIPLMPFFLDRRMRRWLAESSEA